MSNPKTCRFCGSDELERSEHKGELTCCRCGAVLEESGIVEGLQFTESAGGGMALVGRFVPAGGGVRGFGFMGGESREQSLQRGLNNIQSVADHLRLSPQHVAAAHRLYLMASQRNFSVGRRSLVVAAACLYVICRRERTPHLLIDFADVLRVSVRSLGQVFIKLLRVLHVQVPHVDPSLYLDRFASQLKFNDKTQIIAQTAVRLVQAMKRDWIATGRRPMGLCGAALLIAARYHEVHVDAEQVAAAVRISSPTLSKRLYEFKRTAVAQLPAAALGETDLLQLPALPLPPCRLTKKRHQQQQQQQQPPQILDAEKETLQLKDGSAATPATEAADEPAEPPAAAAAAATDGQKETEGRPLPLGAGNDAVCNELPSSGDILSVAGWIVQTISTSNPEEAAAAAGAAAGAAGAAAGAGDAANAATAAGGDSSTADTKETGSASGDNQQGMQTAAGAAAAGAAAAAAAEGEEETVRITESENPLADLLRSVRARADELLPPEETQGSATAAAAANSDEAYFLHAASGGAATGAAAAAAADYEEQQGEKEEEEDDDDDDTVADMLLNEEERQTKALIWDDLTKDIMPEVHRRLRQKKQKEKEQLLNPNKRRRPQQQRNAALAAAASAAESVRLSLERKGKGLAQRIDEEALEALFAARKVIDL